MSQGDPEAGYRFCQGFHKEVRQCDAALRESGGLSRFGNDDGYLLGPPQAVFSALNSFAKNVNERCWLTLQRYKTEVFAWDQLPVETPPDLKRAGKII